MVKETLFQVAAVAVVVLACVAGIVVRYYIVAGIAQATAGCRCKPCPCMERAE